MVCRMTGAQVYGVVLWLLGCSLVAFVDGLVCAIVFVVLGDVRPLLLSPCHMSEVHVILQRTFRHASCPNGYLSLCERAAALGRYLTQMLERHMKCPFQSRR